MREPTFADAFEVLCLQAADAGRGPILFGDCVQRARSAVRPFLVGSEFPSVYLEFPLLGEPFLDVTVLLNAVDPGTRIDSPLAAGTEAMLDWYAEARGGRDDVCCGFEVDTSNPVLPAAAVHFQPRVNDELVVPFCTAIGEPERARLYLDCAARMPQHWPLSFFGLFRGRPDSPLRICGYLACEEAERCGRDPGAIATVFDQIGFSAYDDDLLERASALMATAPRSLDFQFDVYPDGSFGTVFAIDVQFEVENPSAVHASFEDGLGARVLGLLEQWGIVDDRWKLIADAAFARSLPVVRDDGSIGNFAFTLMPGWLKVRWRDGVLQPAKFYYAGSAGIVEQDDGSPKGDRP